MGSGLGKLLRIIIHVLLLRPVLKLFCGVQITGKENLRGLGRYIVIANHNSHVDTLLLFYLLPIQHLGRTHAVADRAYFARARWLFRLIAFVLQPIWMERGSVKRGEDPLVEIRTWLDRGHNIVIFPEGTRGAPGDLLRFKSGIGRLAADYPQLPIVPVSLAGPERVLPKSATFPLPFWNRVVIGPPVYCRGAHRDITQDLERIINEQVQAQQAGHHQRRAAPPASVPMVAILGIDGSGKSTLARLVAQGESATRRVGLVSDRLELYESGELMQTQPLLTETVRGLISRYAKRARSLKHYKIPKLAELLLRDHLLWDVRRWYRPRLVVMDGSPLLNMVAWAMLYKEQVFGAELCSKAIRFFTAGAQLDRNDPIRAEFPELGLLQRLKLNQLSLPNAVVFLDIDPAVACERIASRGEQRQVHETEDKLGKLGQAYLTVCGVVQADHEVPTLRLDADGPPEQLADAARQFLEPHLARENADCEAPH